ncbi:MAG: hypothetical protein ACI35R_06450 [Bacillus sp. (in: firmicutes)]
MKKNGQTIDIESAEKIRFDYVNWKGVKSSRKVVVTSFLYGITEYHPEPQWLLDAYDLEKEEHRVFAMKDMSNVEALKRRR